MSEQPYTTIYLRPDGAAKSGMGHLYRCRNLAIALRPSMGVMFLIDAAPDAFLSLLDQDGIPWRYRADVDDAIADQVVLFDGYGFGETDFTPARKRENLVIAIDDLASAYFNCDLVISPGPQNRREDYRATEDCRFLLGCEYALINPCFYDQPYAFRPDVRRLFIGFGASDPRNVTAFVAGALAAFPLELDVLVGAGYRHEDSLTPLAGPRCRLHRQLPQEKVATLMGQCDAAIASGGTTSLELAAVGVPALLFAFTENHRRPCLAFDAQDLAVFGGMMPDEGVAAFHRAVHAFLDAKPKRHAIYENTRRLFRASGSARVAAEICRLATARRGVSSSAATSSSVRLVPLASSHLNRTRRWITDPRVAAPFLFSGRVTEKSHEDWFARLETDRTQAVFAVVDGAGEHVGNIGFKNLDREQRSGEMWIYLAPDAQGRGLGSASVREAVAVGFDQFRLERIYLHVSPGNLAARKIYLKSGFHPVETAAKTIPFEDMAVPVDCMELAAVDSGINRQREPRVSLMQPMFLPWLGYFELMDAADVFVLLDDYQFSRQGWGHRNRLFLSPGRPGILSLPIRHPNNLAATFLDIAPTMDRRWLDKLGKALTQSYGRSPGFAALWSEIEAKLRTANVSLAELEISLIEIMARRLGVRARLRRSSEFPATTGLSRSERLVALLDAVQAGSYYAPRGSAAYMRADGVFPIPRLPVYFQDFMPVPYPQPGTATFVPRLSALDALFSLSETEARAAMHGTRRWLTWDEATTAPFPDPSDGDTV